MARIDEGSPFYGTRGRIGNLIFRTGRYGTTVSIAPDKKAFKKKNKRKLMSLSPLSRAIEYARKQIRNSESYEMYQSGVNMEKRSAYMVALKDFLTAPTIISIETSHYAGGIGERIGIHVTDDFRVKRVVLVIRNARGDVVESGEAIALPEGFERWAYVARTANAEPAGSTVLVTVEDHAQNVTSQTVTL